MEGWRYTFQTNWVSRYSMWVDNSGHMDEFDLDPSNVQMEVSGQWRIHSSISSSTSLSITLSFILLLFLIYKMLLF
jgi:hypothetical protein